MHNLGIIALPVIILAEVALAAHVVVRGKFLQLAGLGSGIAFQIQSVEGS